MGFPRRVRLVALATSLSLAVAASHARAEPTPEDKALATALFKEAKKLIEEDRVGEACRKFEESQRLDPSGGTLLNLGVCHEREGRFASAWTELAEALSIALRDGRDDRAKLAREHIATLEGRLSWLVVVVPATSDVPGLEIKRDGTVVRRPAWGTAMPVDRGEHGVEVSAPGKKTWSATVVVGPERDKKQIDVPLLEDLPAVPPPPPSATLAPSPAPLAPSRGVSAWRDGTMIGAGAVGVVAVALGGYFGLHAIGLSHDAEAGCPGGRCSQAATALSGRAVNSADASTALFVVGAVGLGAAAALFFTRTPVTRPTSAARVVGMALPGAAFVGIDGRF